MSSLLQSSRVPQIVGKVVVDLGVVGDCHQSRPEVEQFVAKYVQLNAKVYLRSPGLWKCSLKTVHTAIAYLIRGVARFPYGMYS